MGERRRLCAGLKREPAKWTFGETMKQVHKLGAIGVVALVLTLAGCTSSSSRSTTTSNLATNTVVEWTANTVPAVVPLAPGPLAISPNGNLYVADDAFNEILERLPSGHFVVVAGTGHAGFSGEGGQATRADIDGPEGMAFAKNGTLYFADSANNRVRAVRPNGVIVTVAGNGKDPRKPPRSGTPALQAGLGGPTAVTISPGGKLYVALADGNAVVEIFGAKVVVSADAADFGNLDPQSPGSVCEPSGLAFDSGGDLFINCGNFYDVIMRRPNGRLVYRGFLRPHDAVARLAPGPHDSVLGVYQSDLVSFTRTDRSVVHVFRFVSKTIPFWPTGVAVGGESTIYVDQEGDAGVGPPTIIALSSKGKVTVLWLAGSGKEA